MGTKTDEWIGVKEVATEMQMSERQAWELVKKLGVPCVGPVRDCMRMARFTRSDYEDARDRSKAPPTLRSSRASREAAKPARVMGGTGIDIHAWKKLAKSRAAK